MSVEEKIAKEKEAWPNFGPGWVRVWFSYEKQIRHHQEKRKALEEEEKRINYDRQRLDRIRCQLEKKEVEIMEVDVLFQLLNNYAI